MRKVLLLSASTGGGHNSAAKAIKDSLEEMNIEVSIVDALKFASPVLDRLVSGGYERSAKYIPKTYGALYRIAGTKPNKSELDVIVRTAMGKKILNLIEDTNPDAIIGTHPFPTMSLMKYKELGMIDIPIISLLTDYTAHPAYIQKNIDAYIAGDEDVSYLLKSYGIDQDKIYPFGIPISKDFIEEEGPGEIREQLQLEDKFTVLLMGGSFGAGNMKKCMLELLESSYDFQIIVVTGRDALLKRKLQRIVDEINPNKVIRVLGFTKEMPKLLAISDVLVTKPGGLTTTEAIIKAVPMVIPYFIPGQEEDNISFLLNNGLALRTFKNYTLSSIIEILMDNPDRRQEIVDRMIKRRKIDASKKIAELTLELINKRENKNA